MARINTSKMTRTVRLLWENAQVYDLSLRTLGQYLGVSHMAIKRWFEGAAPTPENEAMILAACEKITAKHDAGEGRAFRRGGAVWHPDNPKDPRVLKEKRRLVKMQLLFYELERRLSPAEKELLVQEEPAWAGFQEILGLIRKHGLKIPRS